MYTSMLIVFTAS